MGRAVLSRKTSNKDAAGGIVEAAAAIASVQGMGGVTARAVAAAAGVAPSAIIYHFKTLPGLLSAVHDHIEIGLGAWRDDVLRAIADPAARLLSAESVGIATLNALIRDNGHGIILQQELRRAALRGVLAFDRSPAAALDARQKFWVELLHRTGFDEGQSEIWGAVAEGLVSLALLDRVQWRREALIVAVMRRVTDRLTGKAITALLSDPILPVAEAADVVPRGKRQIIDAAMRIIGRDGADRLTHRKVAAEAGLSLASTTYFYATKEDLVADAFYEIQRRSVHAVVSSEMPRHRFISAVMLTEDGEERWELAAMLALNQAAIRSERFDDLALTLRQVRGIDGLRWLRAHGRANADQLDGIIWSAATTPIGEYALCLPRAERRSYLDRETARAYDMLFG